MPQIRTQWILLHVLISLGLGLNLEGLAGKTKSMFHHGFTGYMKAAFPFDELAPISCTGLGPDHSSVIPARLHRQLGVNPPVHHDFRGGFCLTLIDTLDTLAVLGKVQEFHRAVDDVTRTVHSFEIDLELSVFELNIRVLGGLLSAHQFCVGDFGDGFVKPGYKNELLNLAVDLGNRLLPAFRTGTGIPVARVNLKTGVKTSITLNNPAAGSTFLLEFGLLSVLTGDQRFYDVAEKALFAIWEHRSELDLLGIEIDVESGQWIDPASTIGASTDSFYEYLLKAYIMFGDSSLLEVYQASSTALHRHQLDRFGNFRTVDCNSGRARTGRMDALGAFFPGLLVLEGDISSAKLTFNMYYLEAMKHGAGLLAEAFDVETRQVINTDYNLRPELIESAYYLYQATRDSFYLKVGENMLNLIEAKCRTSCGYARLRDVSDAESKVDQSESFLLSETLKYLYLLFSPDHWMNKSDKPIVFSTEAHPLIFPKNAQRKNGPCSLYRCPAASSNISEKTRLMQYWNVGLDNRDIDSYNEMWHASSLSRPNHSPLLDDALTEAVSIPNQAFLLSNSFGIRVANNVTLSVWPDIQSPAYTLLRIENDTIQRDEQVVMILRRKRTPTEIRKTFAKLPCGNWFHFSFDLGVTPRPKKWCSRVMPFLTVRQQLQEDYHYFSFKKFSKMVPLPSLVRSLIEEPSGAVYRGLPVKNLRFRFLVDYVFDHVMSKE